MTAPSRWRSIAEALSTGAVVLSLVYVAVQVRQNTAAIETSTRQSLYSQYTEAVVPLLENEAMAELLVRADTAPESLSASDSLRVGSYYNLELNVAEAAYLNIAEGTIAYSMGGGWLSGLGYWGCSPLRLAYWRASSETGFNDDFRMTVDSAIAATEC